MRGLSFLTLCLVLVMCSDPGPVHILIYTRNGEGYVHDNIPASVRGIRALCMKRGYTVDATDNSAMFTDESLARFDCIIFSNTNNEVFDTEAQRKAFRRYINKGGGFVGIHSASGTERQWPWFWAMLGGKFVRHPKYQSFTLKVIDPAHPSTGFLGPSWKRTDECYMMDNLNPDIHVLLAADLATVEDPEREKYPGTTFGQYFPLAWCHTYDGGREFYTALGHDSTNYKDPEFLKHLDGGIEWVLDH